MGAQAPRDFAKNHDGLRVAVFILLRQRLVMVRLTGGGGVGVVLGSSLAGSMALIE